jgi:hypothetical protein
MHKDLNNIKRQRKEIQDDMKSAAATRYEIEMEITRLKEAKKRE